MNLSFQDEVEVIHVGNLFAHCYDVHYHRQGHKGVETMFGYVELHYHNITRDICSIIRNTCPICFETVDLKKEKLIGVIRPIKSSQFRGLMQADLIDLRNNEELNP